MPLVGLVDSGADSSLLDVEYAYHLGLKPEEAEHRASTGADGNEFETLAWPNAHLELQFGTDRFAFLGSFFEFPAGKDGINLLGRSDFFKLYVVQFWESESLMNIDLSPDVAQGPINP